MKKLAIISTIILGLAATSCNNYMDINQDPNSPTEGNMTPSIMMPAAISRNSNCFIAGAKLRFFFETAKKKPPIHIEDIFSYLFNTFYCLKEPYYLRSETRSSLFKNTMLT